MVAVAWGLLTGSQLIVFDGLYSFASVALSLMAVLALRTARRGPDERYPWGREVWEPLTVVVKAAALGGLSVYALVGGVGDVLAGGREVEVGLAVVYGVVATLVGVAVTVVLRRRARAGASDLVRGGGRGVDRRHAAERRGARGVRRGRRAAAGRAGGPGPLRRPRHGRRGLARRSSPSPPG